MRVSSRPTRRPASARLSRHAGRGHVWRRKITTPLSTTPSGPNSGAANALEDSVCTFRTSRAVMMWSSMTTSTPWPRAPGDAATRVAASRFAGPSQLGSDTVRIAPTSTTGLPEVSTRSSRYAVSSIVSVPWVMTRPSMSGRSSHAAARRASRHICSGVTWGPGSREKSSVSTSATARIWGTCARISAAPSAGTAAPVAGSIRMEMVPPVNSNPIISASRARPDTSRRRRC